MRTLFKLALRTGIAAGIAPVLAIALIGGTFAVAAGAKGSARNAPAVEESIEPTPTATPSADPTPSVRPTPSPTAGGTVDRFHGDQTTPCTPPDGATMEGNWTHGAFVSAWAKAGGEGQPGAAARSSCGKPATSVEHRSSAPGTSPASHGNGHGHGHGAGSPPTPGA